VVSWRPSQLPLCYEAGSRRELPHDLANEMEDVREKGEEVEEVSIGVDGDWFLRTDARHGTSPPRARVPVFPIASLGLWLKKPTDATACKIEHAQDMCSNVELFVQLVQQAGLSLEQYAIQFFTFVPDPTGYVTVLHKTVGSLTRCAWHNVPQELDMVLEREALKGVRHVTVGINGSYVVLLNSGVMWWSGVPDSLHRLLDEAEKRKGPAVVVSVIVF